MTTWNAARAALDTKMAALAGVPDASIAWPGRKYPATGSTFPSIWYKPVPIPTGTDTEVGSGAVNRPRGTYQVSIFLSSSEFPGIAPLLAAADAVVAHFDRAALSGVQCGVPTLGPVIQEPDWLHLPVSIPFVCP